MPSNTQFIRQAVLHEDSVMKRQSLTHIVSACSILRKSQYRKRHDKVGTDVHWLLCKKHHLQCSDKWYTHKQTHTHQITKKKNDRYQVLITELQNVWNIKVVVITVVIGALATMSKRIH